MSKKEAAEKYFKLGEQKYNKKDYQGAIADYDKAIELNPKDVRAYYNRGNAKYELKQYKEAYCRLRQSHRAKPKICRYLQQPRHCKILHQTIREAIKDFNKAIELDPKDAQTY